MVESHVKKDLLPRPIVDWLESTFCGELVLIKPRAGGGAVRMGAEVEIASGSGQTIKGFLAYDGRQRPMTGVRDKYIREASILKALGQSGIRMPKLFASSPDLCAHLFEFVPGQDRFSLVDPEDALPLVEDFLADLAKLHNIDAGSLELEGFGPICPPADYIKSGIVTMRKRHFDGGPQDPFVMFGLRWLEKHIPAYEGPTVIVHGDAGPGNFLFEGRHVKAVLDWELSHYGDPMEDFAWMSIRAIIQAWVPFPPMLEAYERLSGIPVDLDRIRYYRIYTLLSMIIESHRRFFQQPESLSQQSQLGNGLMFMMVHRRAYVHGLADAMRIPLPEVTLPPGVSNPLGPYIASLLAQLKDVIVPRSADQFASTTAKDMARTLKYLDARLRLDSVLEEDELNDVNACLGKTFNTLPEAKAELLGRLENDSIGDAEMIGILWRQVMRETAIAEGVLGALGSRFFPALE